MTDLNDAATTLVTPIRNGRLAVHLAGFAARLGDQGYAPATMRQKHDLLAEFGRWMEEHDVPLVASKGMAVNFWRNAVAVSGGATLGPSDN